MRYSNNQSVNEVLSRLQKNHRESKKWSAYFAVFALICMISSGIVDYVGKHSDYLGGRKTILQYYRINMISIFIILGAFMLFLITVFRMWRGKNSSFSQILMTILVALIIIGTGTMKYLALKNIDDDLKHMRKITVCEYVLCQKNNKNFYMGIEDKSEYALLEIPKSKYYELKGGERSIDTADSEVYELVANSSYGGYENLELYKSSAYVEYYFYSAIYQQCRLEKG